MRPTMNDVAEKAGVSIGTVSLVLNDKPGISTEMRAAVMAAADDLGYRKPERRARVTEEQSASTSLLVVHFAGREQPSDSVQLTGVLVDYVDSIQEFFQDQPVNLTLLTDYREDNVDSLGFRLLENRSLSTDGVVLIGPPDRDSRLLNRAIAEGVPVVVLSRYWPELPVSSVSQDHKDAAFIGLEHLLQLGHETIAFLATEVDRGFDWFEQRLACYRSALAARQILDEELIVIGTDGHSAAMDLMARRPDVTAIFCVHDEVAVRAMEGLQAGGYSIPADVSVIGQDDSAGHLSHLPALTTVGFPHRKVGQLAAELLMRQVHDDELAYAHVFVRSCLLQRETCVPPRQHALAVRSTHA